MDHVRSFSMFILCVPAHLPHQTQGAPRTSTMLHSRCSPADRFLHVSIMDGALFLAIRILDTVQVCFDSRLVALLHT